MAHLTGSERLSDAEVEALAALEKAATPGPWTTTWKDRPDLGGHVFGPDRRRQIAGCRGASGYPLEEHDANAVYIAAARNALPRLLAERAALREALAKALDTLDNASSHWHVIPGTVQLEGGSECPACVAEDQIARTRLALRALLAPQKETK